MMTTTIELADKLFRSQANAERVATYIVMKAHAETIRADVDKYEQKIFEEFVFLVDPKTDPAHAGERITKRSSLYITDLEGETYLAFLLAVKKAHIEHGYNMTGKVLGWCPAYAAECDAIQARNEMTEAARVALEMPEFHDMELLDQFAELLVATTWASPKRHFVKEVIRQVKDGIAIG